MKNLCNKKTCDILDFLIYSESIIDAVKICDKCSNEKIESIKEISYLDGLSNFLKNDEV